MEKLKMRSPDLSQENIANIRDLFPGCVTEARDEATGQLRLAVDFDQLRQELSDHIVEGPQERYRLDWPGKREALALANAPIAKTLRPYRDESVNFDTTQNIFIEGDNLDALKLLQEMYLGKVKVIYIDPPYNTGKDFIYCDNFEALADEYAAASKQKDDVGNRLIANPDSSGRYHSDWLSMIYPRIKIARNLLAADGFLFVSIGEDEIANLTKVCDEVFGADNFVAHFVWNTEGHTDNQYDVKINHEYVLLYSKSTTASLAAVVDPNTRAESNLWRGYAENSITKNGSANPPSEIVLPVGFPCVSPTIDLPANAPGEGFFKGVIENGYVTRELTQKFNVTYPIRMDRIVVDKGALVRPCRVFSGWANAEKLRTFIQGGCKPIDEGDGNTLRFYLSDRGVIYYRRDRDSARNILSVLRNFGTTEQMRSELERSGIPFQYPKPKQLIKYLLKIGLSRPGIVLDFFAGSGTTGHALMELCIEQSVPGATFVLCQLPEPLSSSDARQKPGHDFCVRHSLPPTIAELCKERLRRSGAALLSGAKSSELVDVGFRVLKVDTSNMQEVHFRPDQFDQENLLRAVDNIKRDRTAEDLLFQVLVDWGGDLTASIAREVVQGKTVFFVNKSPYAGPDLIACFDAGITEELAKELAAHIPVKAVFRDSGFISDAVKINVEQVFRQLSPGTDVRSI